MALSCRILTERNDATPAPPCGLCLGLIPATVVKDSTTGVPPARQHHGCTSCSIAPRVYLLVDSSDISFYVKDIRLLACVPSMLFFFSRHDGMVTWEGFECSQGLQIEGTGVYRINGNLAVARAIGDIDYRPWVSGALMSVGGVLLLPVACRGGGGGAFVLRQRPPVE